MSTRDAPFAGTARFVVERQIGAGGMGVVYAAHDRERDARIALKVLPEVAPTALLRFKREFRSIASITHPNLVQLYELHADDERWFFTMELVDGVDLAGWVRPDALDLSRVRETLKQLARGVHAIHAAGRLHRDLKPSNIMVRRDGSVVILDFGLVGELGGRGDDLPSGTAPYMAPEQWSSAPLTAATDWYAVGVLLHEILTGEYPFTGSRSAVLRAKLERDAAPPSALNPDVPPDLDALCRDLLLRDPDARPSGAEVLRRLGVNGQREFDARAAHAKPDDLGPIVGRERHLAQLAEAFSAVESGATVTAHIRGRSGAGKSLLLEHFVSRLRREGDVAVLTGRCYEQESVPFKALDALVDALADHLLTLPSADVVSLVPVQAAALARVFPVLRRVPAIAEAPGAGMRMADPRETRRAGAAALRELLTRLGQRFHVVLMIDDLQWGDQDSAVVLAELLAPPDPPRLLLALSYRSEYADRSPCLATLLRSEVVAEPWQRRMELDVEPLSIDEGKTLARVLLSEARGVSDDDYARIARESGGNPYFVHELARHAGRDGGVSAHAGHAMELDEVLWERVQALPAMTRELLSIVAVAGQRIALQHVLHAASDTTDHLSALAQLRAENFIRLSGPGLHDDVEAWHDRVRETVVGRLSKDTVRALHSELATTLQADENADAETIARHFEGAGDGANAARYYARGAADAAAALAFDSAARLYRLALRWPDHSVAARAELQRELGRALANAGRGFEAAQAYEAAVEGTPPSDRFEVERLAAQQYCISGHVSEGRAIFRRLLDDVGIAMPTNRLQAIATVLGRRVQLRMRGLGFTERAEADVPTESLRLIDLAWSITSGLSVTEPISVAAIQTTGLLLALRAGEPRRLARALAYEAFLTSTSGVSTIDRAAALMERADAIAGRMSGDAHVTSVVQLMKGLVAYCQASVPKSRALLIDAEEALRTRCNGMTWEIATARTILIFLHWHSGDCEGMRRATNSYLADARDRGDLFLVTGLRAMAATFLHLIDDDPASAQRELDDAMRDYPHDGFDLQRSHEMFSTANIRLYEGRGEDALAWITEWWPALRRSLQMSTQLALVNFTDIRARATLAAAAQRTDNAALLRRVERDARTLLRQGTPLSVPMAHSVLGGVASLRGDRARAVAELKTCLRLADDGSEGFRAIFSRYRLGQLLTGAEGAGYRVEAADIIARERIKNPQRAAAMFLPGFAD